METTCAKHGIEGVRVIAEDTAFQAPFGLSKAEICDALDLGESLYNPGWFYQQILKLGAPDCITDLSENYLIWDSDLLPVATWPVYVTEERHWPYRFALLQDRAKGNEVIIACWEKWIRDVLEVEPATDPKSSFVPHHMWFNANVVAEITAKLNAYYNSDEPWPLLMMRSANEFGTFSEFWLYASWLGAHHPDKLRYHAYRHYGATTERFFDDGSGKFSQALRQFAPSAAAEPGYTQIREFIDYAYADDQRPSSLSFESSPRHLKKGTDNMHVEELRSQWHMTSEGTGT